MSKYVSATDGMPPRQLNRLVAKIKDYDPGKEEVVMSKWKDESRKDEIVASKIRFGQFRLSVHHCVGCGDEWVGTCYGLFNCVSLSAQTMELAKKEATAKLKGLLEAALGQIENK